MSLAARVLFAGSALAGCLTSADCIGARSRPAYRPALSASRDQSRWVGSWAYSTQEVELQLSLFKARTLYGFASLQEGLERLSGRQRARFHEEVDFLRILDGIVFVADSQQLCLERNLATLRSLERDLREVGREPAEIPLVFQFNKRDLPNVSSVERMAEVLIWPQSSSHYASIATQCIGVIEPINDLLTRILYPNLAKLDSKP